MFVRSKKQMGFTLIELLVVVIIVAVLAAVGVPLLSGNIERARASEAEAGLGTIRTGMRAKLAETNGVLPALGGVTPDAAGIGINPTDLDGRFFSTSAYTVTAPRTGGPVGSSYCAAVDGGTSNTAPKNTQVALVIRSMDENGNIYQGTTGCTGTPVN